jgi:L-ascorbate metabolism protein UlaG (beta-lactamase superfamily)
MKKILLTVIAFTSFISCKDSDKKESDKLMAPEVKQQQKEVIKEKDSVQVMPVSHGSFAIVLNNKTLYVDPVGGVELYTELPKPNLVLITDIHGDHLDVKTLEGLVNDSLTIIAPKAVNDKLPPKLQNKTQIINNGDLDSYFDIQVEAIPMYNLREEAKKFHEKGRGNGYVLSHKGNRVYVSGDTEDIPEMRKLKDIDIAFICMNLPYTMTVESAADAVLDFKPKKVYPYHYRGTEGLSDIEKFKKIVNDSNSKIEIQFLNWYPESKR